MSNKATNDIVQIVQQFNEAIKLQLPLLESQVSALIESKTNDSNAIEHCLDTLLSLTNHGFGEDLFVRLLDYYKTIDAESTMFYWNEFDKTEE